MKYLPIAMLVAALVSTSCNGQPPKPAGYFVLNGLSMGSPVADVRKVVAKVPNDYFKSDNVPRTGKGLISCAGGEPSSYVFMDSLLCEYLFTDYGDSERTFQGELARFTALYGEPETVIAKLPAGAPNKNNGAVPAKFAFWISPDKSEALLLEWARKEDGVITTLVSLFEDPYNKNLPH